MSLTARRARAKVAIFWAACLAAWIAPVLAVIVVALWKSPVKVGAYGEPC